MACKLYAVVRHEESGFIIRVLNDSYNRAFLWIPIKQLDLNLQL
jgi:hypothetical protein